MRLPVLPVDWRIFGPDIEFLRSRLGARGRKGIVGVYGDGVLVYQVRRRGRDGSGGGDRGKKEEEERRWILPESHCGFSWGYIGQALGTVVYRSADLGDRRAESPVVGVVGIR